MPLAATTTVPSTPCSEIWSGNGSIHNALSVPGLDAWLWSDPFHGDDGGGDIHYASSCAASRISRFAVMDIAGHGMVAAKLGHRLRAMMRELHAA
jgi:hypothetical protein